MKVGDLVQSNMWFVRRKKWDEKRIGLVVKKEWVKIQLWFEIMWLDNNEVERETPGMMNAGSRWTKVIGESTK